VTGFALCASVHVLAALKTSRIRSPYSSSSSTPSSFSTAPKKLLKYYIAIPHSSKKAFTLFKSRNDIMGKPQTTLFFFFSQKQNPQNKKSLSCGEISMIRNNSKFRGSKKE
jgi:murein endopeptidase